MTDQEIIATIALTQIPGVGLIGARNLINVTGNAEILFSHRTELTQLIPGISPRTVESLNNPQALLRAEAEYSFAQKNKITCITINDEAYPSRLRECPDAPVVLFFKGKTDLNALKVINMVGTRNATDYGQRICNDFLQDLKTLCPEVLVVSGLAYGIDIYAHRAALRNQLATVGVLAHGLDRIYPATHRKTAIEMLDNGGLLTEFLSETNPDRQNFVKRNRIVAGMSDATIVVESAVKGGALITADIAQGYHRDCFAFPGRVADEFSIGCNNLIKDNKAGLILSAEDFVKAMCWDADSKTIPVAVQRELFIDLTQEEQQIVDILRDKGNSQINSLVVEADIAVNKMNALLFELEMKGVIRVLAGGMYQLL
ncbi:DNA-processing protein DprA [uncultured Bacteroides sp.]|uniref:DNA-processing protein DprA n=1 Tax=uncultured Bacteroides sp. TaxID=162156 RepID=UPI002AA92E3E|nr:DNA-processing protein DprA [uncultured Bacteroides sp.]